MGTNDKISLILGRFHTSDVPMALSYRQQCSASIRWPKVTPKSHLGDSKRLCGHFYADVSPQLEAARRTLESRDRGL